MKKPPMTDEEKQEARRLYCEQELSCKRVGERLGRHPATIYSALASLGVDMRRSASMRYVADPSQKKIYTKYTDDDRAEIIRLYTEENLGCSEIGRRFGKTKDAVRNLLARNHIEIRGFKEAQRARYAAAPAFPSLIHFDQPHLQAAFEAELARVKAERGAEALA